MSSEEQPIQNKRPEPPKGMSGGRRRGRRGGRGRSRGPRRHSPIPTQIAPVSTAATAPEPAGLPEGEHDEAGRPIESAPHQGEPAEYQGHSTETETMSDSPETISPVEHPEDFETAEPVPATGSFEESGPEESRELAPPADVEPIPAPPARHREPAPYVPPQPFRPAAPSAITQAIEEITKVVDALRQALDQMDEALELVELAERQKLADEREIDALRRALRQFQNAPRHRREDRREDRREEHRDQNREPGS